MRFPSFAEVKRTAPELVLKYHDATPIASYPAKGCLVDVLGIEDGYQIARFTYEPGMRVESHAHASLSAVHFFLRGSVTVWSKSRHFLVNAGTFRRGRTDVFVFKGLSHGAEIGPDGLQFISVERHDGIPQPVEGCPHRIWKTEHDSAPAA